jgi:hypothetical protein
MICRVQHVDGMQNKERDCLVACRGEAALKATNWQNAIQPYVTELCIDLQLAQGPQSQISIFMFPVSGPS